MDNFFFNNLNTTQGGTPVFLCNQSHVCGKLMTNDVIAAYLFNVTEDGNGTKLVQFTVQSNETNTIRYGQYVEYATYVQVPMMVSLQRQLCMANSIMTFINASLIFLLLSLCSEICHKQLRFLVQHRNDWVCSSSSWKSQQWVLYPLVVLIVTSTEIFSTPWNSHWFGRADIFLWMPHVQLRTGAGSNQHWAWTPTPSYTQVDGIKGAIQWGVNCLCKKKLTFYDILVGLSVLVDLDDHLFLLCHVDSIAVDRVWSSFSVWFFLEQQLRHVFLPYRTVRAIPRSNVFHRIHLSQEVRLCKYVLHAPLCKRGKRFITNRKNNCQLQWALSFSSWDFSFSSVLISFTGTMWVEAL